jgi:hypothetical protein
MDTPGAETPLERVIERLARARQPGFACTREGALLRLEIWGSFPPDWCGNLSLQCYAARLGVASGEARRVRASHWAGHFLLRSAGGEPLANADFVRMARRRPKALLPPSEMPIDELRISLVAGAAEVRLAAADRLGFLAYVLDRFGFCGLYPHGLVLRTSPQGRIDDWFRLLGVGGTPPSEPALAMLANVLGPARRGPG